MIHTQMSYYLDDLFQACHYIKEKSEIQKISEAFKLLEEVYNNNNASSISFPSQPLEIAAVVAREIGLNNDSIISSMLYETVLTERASIKTIEERFGKEVSILVSSLCKISSLKMDKISLNAENFIQLMLIFSEDIRALLIKLAEKIHFMRRINSIEAEKQKQIVSEVISLYAPLAHRLGMYHVKTELEEQTMKFMFPDIYSSIEQKIEETKEQNEIFIREFKKPIEDELSANGLKFEVKARTKSIPSIWNKMKKQNIDFEQVYDFFAIRIISLGEMKNEKEDCWKIYSIVTNIYQPNPSRMRDWISAPKSSGYESLHITVIGPEKKWVEVQVRSKRMDDEAEKGQAAHWKYKGQQSKSAEFDLWLNRVREIVDNFIPGDEEQADKTKVEPFNKHVYVFTPKGDVRKLKTGATVLDFAFDIHTNVGSHCNGAKVNNVYVPIKHVLKTGDIVEITTSKNQKPSFNWLNIAITTKALSKIKRILKEAEFAQSDMGRDMLKRKINQLKINYSDDVVNKLVTFYKATNVLEFFQGIATQKYDLLKVKDALLPVSKTEEIPTAEKIIAKTIRQVTGHKGGQSLIIINDNTAISDYKLAKCCKPVYGDQIFGFVTVTEGIKLHRTDCSNAPELHLRFAYRVVKATWSIQDELSKYLVTLQISGIDQFGLLNSITETITVQTNADIRGINLDTRNGKFESSIVISVSGKRQLDLLVARLSKLKGVSRVIRIS